MPADRKRPSIKDVAARAGVSWKTVTNVMHGRANVRPETRDRVLAAVDELGYRPNPVARQLQEGRSRVITLAIPDITSSYFSRLAARIIELARGQGWMVVIRETRGDTAIETAVLEDGDLHYADGVILAAVSLSNAHLQTIARTRPLVVIGQRDDPPGPNHVIIDNIGSAVVATQHLLDLGRRRLAFVGGTQHGPGHLRQVGFLRKLAAAGLEPAGLIGVRTFDRKSGADAVTTALDQGLRADALVCAVDSVALGAMFALRQHGVQVPDDVAVLGWDNIEDGAYSNPTLTTIAPDVDRVAEAAVTGVLQRIREPKSDHLDTVHVRYELIHRESTGGPLAASD
ncbi:LacI family DNA-binding transcriptional regulator [Parenemella sanctibonifatiensis]|nr:LacI family DNA-binding transcriptional regulator [Parenemella sanctibonifatiensis]